MDIQILYEDNHIIVVLKPQNIPSQSDQSNDKDMLTIIKEYIKQKYLKPGNVFVGLVHRLDRPTGGIMVFAKTSKAASRLSNSLANGEFEKKYFAVCEGVPKEKKGHLVNYLIKLNEQNIVKIVPQTTENAKRAELEYVLLETTPDNKISLLNVILTTGRSHQIRVQMSNIRHPVFGDYRYGRGIANTNLALWATILKFPHPIEKKIMSFIAYPPEEYPWALFDIKRHLAIYKKD